MIDVKGGSAAQVQHKIDRGSDWPIYIQLAEILRQQISVGMFRPGDQLPSESHAGRDVSGKPNDGATGLSIC